LKIDQSFVRGMRDNRSDLLMVRSTINLAHSLERTVVAEGVEDEETLNILRQMNCDRVQGFLVGRPMSFQSLTRRLIAARKGQAA
jgi:EAL domain-containing protein (putative c-di-GMP-specific phosphodiesterase class I)